MTLQGSSIVLAVLVLFALALPILGWGLTAFAGVPVAQAGGWCW